ncbi:A/G-specific adenine glycosylase [Bombella pollinis]|uniref:Adenine DNA glycosylase n=1 Tax=Bombella pollinis TaxID=2967337 RepID=A0ABT3WJN9_9PROT|nr:A/G-specific adenine glycosylase [Bombella pollinis]MCX5619148.1 A/G-specific adenine glycosylase [Bombella pollinis]
MTPNSAQLLQWYDRHRRNLPWRAAPGQQAEPYHVWLSEIMLQQTVAQTVIPYYERFLEHFPTIDALAAAPLETVLQLWAGLGYYARARNLHACAKAVHEIGGFPSTIEALQKLPGIGAYTSRAIAAIAFNIPTVPVDGNVERITARLNAVEEPLPASRPLLAQLASHLNDDPAAQARPSDFAQALFDLGASLCSPRSPSCLTCPWHEECLARIRNLAPLLPAREKKKPRPTRHAILFRIIDAQGRVLLRPRPPSGLLGGTDELPGTPWADDKITPSLTQLKKTAFTHDAPFPTQWEHCGEVKHIFSHFTLMVHIYGCTLPAKSNYPIPASYGRFLPFKEAILSSVMKKCLLIGTQHKPVMR